MSEVNLLEKIQQSIDELKEISTIGTKEVLSLDEVCQIYDIRKQFLYQLTHSRRIPFYKAGGGKYLFFKKSEVEAFLLSSRFGTIEEAEQKAEALIAANKAKRTRNGQIK